MSRYNPVHVDIVLGEEHPLFTSMGGSAPSRKVLRALMAGIKKGLSRDVTKWTGLVRLLAQGVLEDLQTEHGKAMRATDADLWEGGAAVLALRSDGAEIEKLIAYLTTPEVQEKLDSFFATAKAGEES